MEEFSPSLAKEFLEHLKAECSSLAAIGDLAVKLKTLQIVFDITSATKYFDSLFEKLKRQPLYNIDRDVDYGEWANLDGWVNKVERIWWNSSESHGYKPDGSEKKEAIDTIYMSSRSFVRDKKESKAIIDEEKSKIHSAIDVLLSDVYFGSEKIDVAINNALIKLTTSLNSIDKAIKNGKWKEEQYSDMVNDILKMKGAVKAFDCSYKKYNEWKNKNGKNIDVPMLKRKLTYELIGLFESKFIIYDITEIDKQKANSMFVDAEYDSLDYQTNEDLTKEYTRLYYKLRLLINYRDGRFDFDDLSDLGMYIFQNRHSLEDAAIDAMVRFIKTTTYIYEDIDKMENNENQQEQSVEELKCTLSKEKIELCNFKIHKEIWLAIIEEHEKELKDNKALWVSVYCVLLKYEVIEDNKRQFCLMMNSLFEVKIDESNLGKDIEKYQNKEYKEWDVNKKSARKRDLAIEMDKRYKNYIQSKRDVIMESVK